MFCLLNGNSFPFSSLDEHWKYCGSSESNNFNTWRKLQTVNELPLAETEILMFIEKSSAYDIPKTSLFFFQKKQPSSEESNSLHMAIVLAKPYSWCVEITLDEVFIWITELNKIHKLCKVWGFTQFVRVLNKTKELPNNELSSSQNIFKMGYWSSILRFGLAGNLLPCSLSLENSRLCRWLTVDPEISEFLDP